MNQIQIQSSDILACVVVFVIGMLAWTGKVEGTVVSAVLGGVIGYLAKDREKEG